ncbi:glycosyltransferase [Ornithinimicrobium pekingense]|uniref:Glycosyltransferase family 2 protein n=1 Tax=Ornithinimicrobium pekingense TaxID=384677 RepID=A0ABQ2F6V4_9MICO|nr:glycosyltransferase [Ornithinimicrobium pekingense]GGK67083.1 hypothetical protein GCM10011509_14290 [Ornithinimicrobium pekingense]
MTSSTTVSRPAPGTRPGRARVDDVTVVVLTHPHGPPLDDLLDALAGQRRRPQRLLVTGLDPEGEELARAHEHPLVARDRVPLLVRDPLPLDRHEVEAGEPALWRVVEDAREALPVHADHWIWLLQDDSLPEPGALEALVGAVRRNSRVGVVGPKLVRLDDPRLLVGVGHHLTVGGRAADLRQAALVDQGQLDRRQDVLGVPLAGSLVRSDLLTEAGGLDPAFGGDGVAGLDLGWRTHLLGQRVVVAPDAVVRQGDAGLGVVDPRRTRVRQRQLALSRGSVWSAPWRALGIALSSTLAALVLLLVKRPREAGDEWADVRAVLRPGRGLGARMRFRSRRTVRPRDLRGLFVPAASGWRSTLDTVGEAVDPRDRTARERALNQHRRSGGTDTGPVSEEFAELDAEGARRRLWSWPLALALLGAVALTGWRWRDLLPALAPHGPGVTGGELGSAHTGSAGLWRSALDGWRGDGLGHDRVAEPWLLPLSAVTRLVEAVGGPDFAPATAGVALGWLLVACVPAAVLTAYLALRRVSRRRWLRAGLALGWAGLAPLTAAVGEGRVGPAVVHVLAPLLLAGYAVSATRAGGVRRTAAVFATVIGVTLAVQWVPPVLVPATLGGLALLVLGRGSARWRGAALAVLPWTLLLPWLPAVVGAPVRLLGGAGATLAGPDFPSGPEAWQVLLLQTGPVDGASLAATPWVTWLTVPLWLAALGALLTRGRAVRRATVLVAAAVVLVGTAMLLPRLALGTLPPGHTEQGEVVTTWPGTMLSLAGAALLLAAGLGLDRLLRVAGRIHAQRRRRLEEGRSSTGATDAGHGAPVPSWLRGPGASAAAVGAVALVVLGALVPLGLTTVREALPLVAAADPLPAVAAEQARGPAAVRTLVLAPVEEGAADPAGEEAQTRSLDVDLRGDEPEPARILRDRAAELATGVPAAGRLADAASAVAGEAAPTEAVAALHDLAVGYVLVEADARHPLVTQVDSLPGLSRVSSPEGQVLWRMTDNDAARVRVAGPDGRTLQRLDVTGPHAAASGQVQDLPEGAALRVSEGQGWHRQATVHVDDRPVVIQPDGRVDLPTGTHQVDVAVRTPLLAWHVLALVLGVVIAFLALPFGRVEADREEEVR